ncbi:phage tail tape measure protein [Paenibacillus bouchesdurhonensis]|uniref:phage tail tape measure protein n=1 Tax=Paenibacillus bouchesdurhonensis TaxID=1870990 RepID=UPI000DA62458|nr:phage tail tape measure protein [Paenibacillus bouchesdurhonensis]
MAAAAGKTYQTTFQLGGKLNPTFNKTFSNANGQFGKMQKEMKKTEGAGAAMANALKKAGAVVAGAFAVSKVVGFGKDIVNTFATFEQAMANVKAVSGAAADDFARLTEKAKEMGAKTSKTAAESADGLQYLALAGWNTEQMLAGIEPVLRLSEAGAMDLGRASDLATDSMAALGIEVKDLPAYLDKVAQTSRRSNTSVEQLMDAFLVAGGTFKTFNVPLEEANSFLGIMANRGYKGAEAGTAMNAIVTNLTSGAGRAGTAMKKLGLSAFDSQGNFKGLENVFREVKAKLDPMTDAQKAQYIAMIAGKEHLKTFTGLLDGLGKEYGDLKDQVSGADGALMDMAHTQMDTFQGSMILLESAIDGVKIQLGEKLAPTIRRVADWMTNYIPVAVDQAGVAFNKVSEWIAPVISMVKTLSGPIISSVKGIGSAVSKLFSGDLTGAGIDIAAALGLDDSAAGVFSDAIGHLIDTTSTYVKGIIDGWKNVAPFVMSSVGSVVKIVKQIIPIVVKVGGIVWQAAGKIVKAIVPIVTYLAGKLWPIISKVSQFIANDVAPRVSKAVNALAPVFLTTFGKIGNSISAMFNFVKPIIDGLVGAFNFAFPYIKTIVIGVVDNITVITKGLVGAFGGIIDFVTGVFTGDWSLAWTGVVDTFGAIWGMLKGLVATPINAVIRLVNMAIESINGISVDIPDWLGGGTLGFSIPKIPEIDAYAKGGIADRPSIFGEAGPEIAIPLNDKPRSHSLLDTANRIMGREPGTGGNSGGDIYIEYSPVYQISGDGGGDVKGQVEKAGKMSQSEFEKMYGQMIKNKRRVAFT